LRADDGIRPCKVAAQDLLIEEKKGAERLILGGGADAILRCEAGQEAADVGLPHLGRVPLPMEEDEATHPSDVGPLRARAVMARASRAAHALEGTSEIVPAFRSRGTCGVPHGQGLHALTSFGDAVRWLLLHTIR